jgi:hypothetical protein
MKDEGTLYYTPLPGGPRIPKVKKVKNIVASRNSKLGRKMEKKVITSMGGILTEASGSVHPGDLDGWITIKDTKYKIEHKTRIVNRNTMGPTPAEWGTMEANGGTLFLTTHEGRTVVTMDIDTFRELTEDNEC